MKLLLVFTLLAINWLLVFVPLRQSGDQIKFLIRSYFVKKLSLTWNPLQQLNLKVKIKWICFAQMCQIGISGMGLLTVEIKMYNEMQWCAYPCKWIRDPTNMSFKIVSKISRPFKQRVTKFWIPPPPVVWRHLWKILLNNSRHEFYQPGILLGSARNLCVFVLGRMFLA